MATNKPLLVSLKDKVAKDLNDQDLSNAFRQVELWSVNTLGVPPPTQSTTTVGYVDPSGQQWVAKAGVYGGQYRLARDVLHAFWFRTAAWTTVTTGTQFTFDARNNDPYGIFNLNTFTAPVAGIYRMDMSIGATATGTGQNLDAIIANISSIPMAYGITMASAATIIQSACNVTRPAAVHEQWMTMQQANVSGLTGRASPDMCRLTVDYLGTG